MKTEINSKKVVKHSFISNLLHNVKLQNNIHTQKWSNIDNLITKSISQNPKKQPSNYKISELSEFVLKAIVIIRTFYVLV